MRTMHRSMRRRRGAGGSLDLGVAGLFFPDTYNSVNRKLYLCLCVIPLKITSFVSLFQSIMGIGRCNCCLIAMEIRDLKRCANCK